VRVFLDHVALTLRSLDLDSLTRAGMERQALD